MESIHIKTPETRHAVSPFITKRWSARAFADRPITGETMSTLFEAASWAASSMNEQPWYYYYAHRDTPAFEKMLACLNEGNRKWARRAAVLILSLAKKAFDRNGQPNRHYMHDTGSANTTLLLQAADLDIYGHMMAGFNMEETIRTFSIDAERWEPACFIALGYLDDPEALDEPFRTRERSPRTRKEPSSFTAER